MKLLVFAHKPPPHHGQSYMVKLLVDSLAQDARRSHGEPIQGAPNPSEEIECYHVDARLSDDLTDIGHVRPQKVLRLFSYCAQAIWHRLRHGVTHFYFVPAPAVKSAIWRDWMVMTLCRPFYRHMIFHWHAVGFGEWLDTARPWERWLSHHLLRKPDLSIVLGEFNRRDIAWLHSRRIEVVPNGIPDPCPEFDAEVLPKRMARAARRQAALRPRETAIKPDPSQDEIVWCKVLFLGLCTREKGLFDAIQAVILANQRLRATSCRIRLLVAGAFRSEEERREFDSLCQRGEPGVGTAWIEYLSFVSGQRKHELLKECDCLCFPTYYGAENFPLVLVESMAYGLSIVTTRWRSIPELLPPGFPGFAEARSPDQIAAALVSLIACGCDPQTRRRFVERYTDAKFVENIRRALLTVARPAATRALSSPQPTSTGSAQWPSGGGVFVDCGQPASCRVLQVFNDYLSPGGEQTSVARIAQDLESGGHQVTRFWKQTTEWVGPGAPPRWKQPFLLWRNPRSLDQLRRLHEQVKPDIWLLHNVVPVVSLGVYRLAGQLGVPIIQWLHNYRPVSPSGTLFAGRTPLRPEDRWIAWKEVLAGSWNGHFATAWLALGHARTKARGDFESVRAWVAISEETRNVFARNGWFPTRLHVVRHSWHFEVSETSSRDDGYFLFLGRMVESKGIRFITQLWAEPAFRDKTLIMAGQGPLADALKDRTSPNVKWIGHVEGKAKRDLIAGCRAMLQPCLWEEPLGIVAYEAFEMGKPVLASNLGGLKEIIQDRLSGRLLEPGNPDVWRNAILGLDANHARELGRAGRKWLEENASPQAWNQQFNRIARLVLAEAPSRKP